MSDELKEYYVQYIGGEGAWVTFKNVFTATTEEALSTLAEIRKSYPTDSWRLVEVVPVAEPAEFSGWQVCFKDEDERWVPTSWTRNYGSIEEAREYLSRFLKTPSGSVYAIFKVSGVQQP
jgi:hypothetical protein